MKKVSCLQIKRLLYRYHYSFFRRWIPKRLRFIGVFISKSSRWILLDLMPSPEPCSEPANSATSAIGFHSNRAAANRAAGRVWRHRLWNRRSVGSASELVSIMAHEAKQQTSIECYSAAIGMWIGCLTGIFFVFFQCKYGVCVFICIEHRFLLLLMAFHHLYNPTASCKALKEVSRSIFTFGDNIRIFW